MMLIINVQTGLSVLKTVFAVLITDEMNLFLIVY